MLARIREWRIDRMTDRIARRPHGRKAREMYGAPDVHDFMWPPVLDSLRLLTVDGIDHLQKGAAVLQSLNGDGFGQD